MSDSKHDEAIHDPRLPKLIGGRRGTRFFSIAALVERTLEQFNLEHSGGSPALREAHTAAQRYQLILDSMGYVLAVESVQVSEDEKAQIVQRVYSEVFGYGPLDTLFADPKITTISLRGSTGVAVRYGHGDLVPMGAMFDDLPHVKRVLMRLLGDAGVLYSEEMGIVETGLTIGSRPISLSIVAPPFTTVLAVDMRLHPAQALTLDDLIDDGYMTAEAAVLIRQIVQSRYGITIVGDSECGKTTLLNALLPLLPDPEQVVVVERAGEMRLPSPMTHYRAEWNGNDLPRRTFGEQIGTALNDMPACLVLDEVRSDEPLTIAPLLETVSPPRLIWSVRGAPDAKRLQSAMGMLARRAGLMMDEARVHALYERLPFVLTTARIREQLQLFSIAEWQSRIDSDYPDYVMIYRYQEGAARPTGDALARWLDTPEA
jgi:Flp pilus assembly CpaF family ATPase